MPFFPSKSIIKQKWAIVLLPNPSDKIKITIHTSTMQSFIALTLFKAEQTSVVVKAQTLPIFIKIGQSKGNHKSVSNLYWQFIHSKTHFWLKNNNYSIKHWKLANISNLKKKKKGISVEFAEFHISRVSHFTLTSTSDLDRRKCNLSWQWKRLDPVHRLH